MHVFDPELSIKDNYLKADDLAFAAWGMAGHEHREQYRDSGNDPHWTAWLRSERLRLTREALIAGELLAFGVADSDQEAEIRPIPASIFIATDLRMNDQEGLVSAVGRTFREVKLCRADAVAPMVDDAGRYIVAAALNDNSPKSGRPNQLAIIHEAWLALTNEIPGFLVMAKSTQNREIQERIKADYPSKFPGNSKIGESTIRRHRRDNPTLFD